jgi:glutamate racemase
MTSDRASQPIAVFDSGVGGLTVLHECLVSLPEEDFLYLGDTAHFPYGTKAPDELRRCVEENTRYLLDRGAKLLIVACNSAASTGLDAAHAIAAEHDVEVVAVIEPEAEIAAAITESGRVGVLATMTTIDSGAYRDALAAQGRALQVHQVGTSDLAPIIQNGSPFDERAMEVARECCAPFREADVDTLILGCTHFPLLAPMLQRMMGRDVRLVTAGHAVAAKAQRILEARDLSSPNQDEGAYRFLCTGDVETFRGLGSRFLQMPLRDVERIAVG